MESQRKRKGRSPEPGLIANPFIKKRNLEWRVSPPPFADPERRRARDGDRDSESSQNDESVAEEQFAEPVADEAQYFTAKLNAPSISTSSRSISPPARQSPPPLDAHITHFTTLLTSHTLNPFPSHTPRLPILSLASLFRPTPHDAHFVVTQHDHPIAGPHYDLRLQISPSSCASWAIMYGLPGDPNSRGKTGRANGSGMLRNATETRVHCLWNSFVETGGWEVGSLLVWDMGVFEVLAPRRRRAETPSDSGEDDGEGDDGCWAALNQQERLARAFASRKIRLKLHGARLPRDYVVNLRLTKEEDAAGRAKAASTKPRRRRRREGPPPQKPRTTGIAGPDTSAESSFDEEEETGETEDGKQEEAAAVLSAMETELRELEDAEVRRTNAYAGAVNSIGSVHQRKWFLSLDREACGFVRTKVEGRVKWERRESEDEPDADRENRLRWPFYVRGPAFERSVVTGRKGEDVLKDHGVVDYVSRKGWRPILS